MKSFSEKLAESRRKDIEIKQREERVAKSRSRGFGIQNSGNKTVAGTSSRASSRADDATNPRLKNQPESFQEKARNPPSTVASSAKEADISADSIAEQTLEPYSGFHLSKRLLDHNSLTRAFEGKEIYPIQRLLKEIKSPHYDPPECESDYVVLGILASKSTPREHKTQNKTIDSSGGQDEGRPKFMVFRLTDLKWEIDIFLFDTGFSRFWKLEPGTVVGILNPGIMPPKIRDSGAFSLKLASSEDTVLEIGRAKDLGFCSAKRADGGQCPAWVDSRKTTVCEFHMNLQVEKTKRGRNGSEYNGRRGGRPRPWQRRRARQRQRSMERRRCSAWLRRYQERGRVPRQLLA